MLVRTPSFRTAARAARHGIRLALLLGLTGCHNSCIGTAETFRVELTSLSSKTVPAGLETDGDVKDVKLTDRASFKPSKGAASGIDKRLRMKSTRDAAAASFVSERSITGDVSSRVRVAFDSTKGLVDGVSTAFLERRPAQPSEEPVLRIEAVYNAAIDGFSIHYMLDDAPVLLITELPPGTHDLHLFLNDLGSSIVPETAVAAGEGLDDLGEGVGFPAHEQTGGDETAVIAFGCTGLGKSGTFYFDQFVLDFDDDASGGPAEDAIVEELIVAFLKLDSAAGQLHAGGTVNVSSVDALLAGAYLRVDAAEQLFHAAITDDALQPGTDAEAVQKSFLNVLVPLAAGGGKTFDLLQDGLSSLDASKLKSVAKQTDKAREGVEVAVGQLNGFKGKTGKQLDAALDFSLP